MRFYWLLLGVLGVWRLTHLVQAEDGPGDLIVRMRRRVGDGFWGSLMDCFNCLSLWIAVPFAYLLGEAASERLFLWPALSGAAILLQRVTQRDAAQPPAVGGTSGCLLVFCQTANNLSEVPPLPKIPIWTSVVGMGVVYRAEDTKLARTVAPKIAPIVKLAGEEHRARFTREAQATAGLNHRNICTLHDIGSSGKSARGG